MPAEPPPKSRLNSWKEVAGFFGKTERTVRRWEAERGLPVHRLPGDTRSGVYADIAELENWLRGPGAAPQTEAASSEAASPGAHAQTCAPASAAAGIIPAERTRPNRALVAGFAIAVSAALAIAVARALPPAPPPLPPAAQALYMKGLQDWAERTPPRLNQAVEEFSAAIRIDANYAEAYVGLADSYILLREFAAMPSSQAYTLAKAAAVRAIALKPELAGAHAAYGFSLVYGDWRFAAGLTELQRALRLEPNNARLEHWYATALMAVGQQNAALAHIDRALELTPGAREVRADRALIVFSQGRYAEARTLLTQLTSEYPGFLSPHAYLAALALATGDDTMFLREEALRASIQHDAIGTAIARGARSAYEAGGHAEMLRALIAARLAALADGTGSASNVAQAYAAAGDRQQTLAYLTRALDRRDDNAFADINNNVYRTLLGDAALAPLRARLALPD